MIRLQTLLLAILFAFSAHAFALKTKKEQLQAMETILAEFRTQYGMIDFKQKTFGVTYDKLREKYGRLIRNAETLEEYSGFEQKPADRKILSPNEFRQLMVGLAAEFRDGHISLFRIGTDLATLGLIGAPIGERLFVTAVRKELIVSGASTFEIKPGDEIISVNGVPVMDLALRNLLYSAGGTFDDRWETALTTVIMKPGAFTRLPPEGERAEVKLRRDGKDFMAHLRWVYTSEYMLLGQRFPDQYRNLMPLQDKDMETPYGWKGAVRSTFRTGLNQLHDTAVIDIGDLLNTEIKQAKKQATKPAEERSEPPHLANLQPVERIPLYMVKYKNRNVGVLRLPSYSPKGGLAGAVAELNWIFEGLRRMQNWADVLVIDQMANSGGMVFYVGKLLSLFARELEPMATVLANAKMSEAFLANIKPDASKDPLTGENPSFSEMHLYSKYYKELRAKYDAGEEWTGLASAFDNQLPSFDEKPGQIFASPAGVFTKPVLILNDGFSGSGGDFFPAQMQYNNRAKVMGTTSCGLGGPLYRNIDSMPGSEMSMRCTSAYAVLPDGWPIENIGTVPDIHRAITPEDLKGNFRKFSLDVLEQAVNLIGVPLNETPPPEQNANLVHILIKDIAEGLKGKTGKEYLEGIAQLIVLAGNSSADRSEWNDVIVPLPSVLTDDLILRTIYRRLEVAFRLKEMSSLPQYKKHDTLIQALVVLSFAAGENIRFGDPCELRAKMVASTPNQNATGR